MVLASRGRASVCVYVCVGQLKYVWVLGGGITISRVGLCGCVPKHVYVIWVYVCLVFLPARLMVRDLSVV